MHRSDLTDWPTHLWLRLRLAFDQEEWKQDNSAAGEITELITGEDNLARWLFSPWASAQC